jgi:TolA-binding protein
MDPNATSAMLIRAARREGPSRDVRRASAAALGLTSAIAAGTTTSSAAASVLGTGASVLSGSALKVVGLALLKGFVVGSLVSGIAVRQLNHSDNSQHTVKVASAESAKLSANQVVPPTPNSEVAQSAEEMPLAPSPSEVTKALQTPSSTTALKAEREPVAAPRTNDSVATSTAVADAIQDARQSTLAEELIIFGRAQRALQHGDPLTALSELQAYQRAYPNGALTPEARVLRIEALFATQNIAGALGEARDFLQRNADGPAARRVRSLIEKNEKVGRARSN